MILSSRDNRGYCVLNLANLAKKLAIFMQSDVTFWLHLPIMQEFSALNASGLVLVSNKVCLWIQSQLL